MFIKQIMDDIHLAIDAPTRPWLALGQIDNIRIRFVKLNTEIA